MSIALAQSKLVAHATGTTSCTASGNGYTSNTTAGSLLVLIAYAQDSSSAATCSIPTINLPTTSGFTWVQAGSADYQDNTNLQAGRVSIFYIANAASMASSVSTSVTATKTSQTGSGIGVEFACYEFTGVSTSAPLDANVSVNTQTSTPTSAGTLVTSGTALIIVGAIGETPSNTTQGPSYTLGITSTNDPVGQTQYILNQVKGNIVTAFAGKAGSPWGCVAVDFLSATQPTPTVTNCSPNAGALAGGTTVTLTGTNFTGATGVTFGGSSATSVTVVNDTTITCVTPSHAAGAVDVVVTTPSGSGTLTSGYTYNPAPTVSSVSPNAGALGGGTSITITGTGFISGCTATLGGNAVTSLVFVNSTTLTGVTPAHSAGTVSCVVTNPDTQTGTGTNVYTYQAAPNPTSVSPNAGALAGGTSVTVSGTGFLTGASVTFGGVSATSIVVVNSTTITCQTPAGSGTVNVVVTNTDTQSGTLTNGYTFEAAPNPTAVSPNAGALAGGTSVTITGTGFLTGAAVTFGGASATSIVVVNSTTITCVTPSGSGAVNVAVTNADTQSGTLVSGYTFEAAPAPTSVSPNNGTIAGGTAVTVSGTGFISGATVTFDGLLATSIVFVNSTTLTCVTPGHAAGLVVVQVTNPDGQVGGVSGYTYNAVVLPAPTLISVSPTSGTTLGGTSVLVLGSNFVSGASVTFGGVQATNVSVLSSTTITCNTPAEAAGTVSVVVTNVDNQSATLVSAFTFIAPPTIVSVSPSLGPTVGGQTVTIMGSGFVAGSQVLFGVTPATSVSFVSASQLNVTTPVGTSGTVNVTVVNPDGQQFVYASGYTYSQLFRYEGTVKNTTGQAASGTQITVLDQSTNLSAQIFSDASGTPLAQPVTSNNQGVFYFYAFSGFYTITINTTPQQVYTNQPVGVGLTPALFRKDLWVSNSMGQPIVGAQVYVVEQPANLSTPPSPLAVLYLDSTGSQGATTQPLSADQFGHCGCYAIPGTYTVVIMTGGRIVATYPDTVFE